MSILSKSEIRLLEVEKEKIEKWVEEGPHTKEAFWGLFPVGIKSKIPMKFLIMLSYLQNKLYIEAQIYKNPDGSRGTIARLKTDLVPDVSKESRFDYFMMASKVEEPFEGNRPSVDLQLKLIEELVSKVKRSESIYGFDFSRWLSDLFGELDWRIV